VFYLYVAYVCNDFEVFSGIFTNVSDSCYMCFFCLLSYITTVASERFKSISDAAHMMRV
jgi:hypothetical protein